MKCSILQRGLLALDRPSRPPADMAAHLARCPACQAWQHRLLEIERCVPFLPVPATGAKSALVQRILAGEGQPNRRTALGETPAQRRDRRINKIALLTSMAAGLVLFAVLWSALQWAPHPGVVRVKGPQPDELLTRLFKYDLNLAAGPQPSERFDTLAGLADELQGQARALADTKAADDLDLLAHCYAQVVREGIIHHARAVAESEREHVANRLTATADSVEQLGRETTEECARPLRELVAAARETATRLHNGDLRGHLLQPPRGRAIRVVPAAILASPAPARSDVTAVAPREQAQRFKRNRSLIQTLVEDGLYLAGEENPLKRADRCHNLVRNLAEAMKEAAGEQEGSRVAELGRHLDKVLEKGVGANLNTARREIPAGSAELAVLKRVDDESTQVVADLETDPRMADVKEAADIHATLSAIRSNWDKVRKSLQGPGQKS